MPSRKTSKIPRVTHALAARHEMLWLKVTALNVLVVVSAHRRPGAPVSEKVIATAEALLAEARVFIGGDDRLPMAAPDYLGLATQVGQALAGLAAWEAANSAWRSDVNGFAWHVAGEKPLPVQRLRSKITTAPVSADAPQKRVVRDVRALLAKRIDQFNRR